MEVKFDTSAALIVAGIVLILSGVFGIGLKIGSMEIPKLEGSKRGILIAAGILTVLLGVALEPDVYRIMSERFGAGQTQEITHQATPTPNDVDKPTPTEMTTATPVPPTTTPISPSPTPLETPDSALSQIDMPSILANITAGPGGIEKAAPWWHSVYSTGDAGNFDPTSPPGYPGCFGVTWNEVNADRIVTVVLEQREVAFGPGGWYSQICVDENIEITPDEVGEIQAEWLKKTYGGLWNNIQK